MDRTSAPARNRLRDIARRAMRERGLEPDFSDSALAQLRRIQAPARELGDGVRDLRERLWCSIDNDDSRDLDQLSVAEPLANGVVRIHIAVADVDALVEQGSPIDEHARTNTTSVYTPAQVFPMLPEKLSTDLTSLNESQERMAIVIELDVDQGGEVRASRVGRALVRNRAKLAYDAVAAWLDGRGPMPAAIGAVPGMEEQLRLQDRVAQALTERRYENGALSLETIEARAVFDGEALTDLKVDEKNRAKQLIESFMVAANGVTARFLAERKIPALRRVLRSPERWARIVELAAEYGDTLPSEPSCKALDEFLRRRKHSDPERYPDVSLSVVKLLGRGEYAVQFPGKVAAGHFGLAVRDYTHSTAPNRRFPDLITQRLIKCALDGRRVPYGNAELVELARHCTEQEDDATKVERLVRKSAAALLLSPRIGERFDGIVTGASDKGTWVRITHPVAEGRVVRGFHELDVGDHARVELVHTDVERGFIDFARV